MSPYEPVEYVAGYKNIYASRPRLQKQKKKMGYKNIQREWVTKTHRDKKNNAVTKTVTKTKGGGPLPRVTKTDWKVGRTGWLQKWLQRQLYSI